MSRSQQDHPSDQLHSFASPAQKQPTEVEPPLPGQRAITGGTQRSCPTCDAPVRSGQTVCPQCGARLQKPLAVIRCRHCGKRASSLLVICPGCGRELQAASPRLLTLGLPVLLVVLLFAVLGGHFGFSNPLSWPQTGMNSGLQVIDNIAITPVHIENTTPTAGSPSNGNALVALRPLEPAPQEASPEVETASVPDSATAEDSGPDAEAAPADTPALAPTTLPATSTEQEIGGGETNSGSVQEDDPETLALAPVAPEPAETATDVPTPAPTATQIQTSAPATSTPSATPSATNPPPTPTASAPAITATAAQAAQSRTIDLRATMEAAPANDPAPPTQTSQTAAAQASPNVAPTDTPIPTATPSPTATPQPAGSYTVKTGDTLVEIAERFGVSIETLLEANALTANSAANLQVGRVLVLPGVASPADERTQTYVVRGGDTFVSIALSFGVDTEALLRANGISINDARRLQVGQVLVIPPQSTNSNTISVEAVSTSAQPTEVPTPEPVQYTVRAGDTVVGIARQFGTTTRALLDFNGLTEATARTLRPGDLLLIPQTGQ